MGTTTSSTLVAGKSLATGKAMAGQGGNGKGRKGALVATAALGLSLLVGGILGQGQQAEQAAQPQASSAPDTHVVTMWDFREDRRAEHVVAADPAGTDDLATNGCVGTAGPFACATGQSLFGTDDLATPGCIGAVGPFACQVGQALAGTDDFALIGCVPVPGPFGCATALSTATNGTDDLATNECIGTIGPFACAIIWEQAERSQVAPGPAATGTARKLPELWPVLA